MINKAPGWIGFDLDGTLAVAPTHGGLHDIGRPIQPMVELLKEYLDLGYEVRIVTARAAEPFMDIGGREISEAEALEPIYEWCKKHIGQQLPVTCKKDYRMVRLYDDRAIQVEMNTGRLIGVTY